MNELNSVLASFEIERIDGNRFRSRSPSLGWKRIYGGLVLAHALIAAARTVPEDRVVHSLHGYFLRAGDTDCEIIIDVDAPFDGRSFSNRQVRMSQNGRVIFTAMASFQEPAGGLSWQPDMPVLPGAEELLDEAGLLAALGPGVPDGVQRYLSRRRPVEMRAVQPGHYTDPAGSAGDRLDVWLRASGPLPADPVLRAAFLAYASDMTILDAVLVPHGLNFFDSRLTMASIDHALWFHHVAIPDGWLLFAQEPLMSAGGRGLARGALYGVDGTLLASATQEGMVRLSRKDEI